MFSLSHTFYVIFFPVKCTRFRAWFLCVGLRGVWSVHVSVSVFVQILFLVVTLCVPVGSGGGGGGGG